MFGRLINSMALLIALRDDFNLLAAVDRRVWPSVKNSELQPSCRAGRLLD